MNYWIYAGILVMLIGSLFAQNPNGMEKKKLRCRMFCKDLCIRGSITVPASCKLKPNYYSRMECQKTCMVNGNLRIQLHDVFFMYAREEALHHPYYKTDPNTLTEEKVHQVMRSRTRSICIRLCTDTWRFDCLGTKVCQRRLKSNIYEMCLRTCLNPSTRSSIVVNVMHKYTRKVEEVLKRNNNSIQGLVFRQSTRAPNIKDACNKFCSDLCGSNSGAKPMSCSAELTFKIHRNRDGGHFLQGKRWDLHLVRNTCKKTCLNNDWQEIAENALFMASRKLVHAMKTIARRSKQQQGLSKSSNDPITLTTDEVYQVIVNEPYKACTEFCRHKWLVYHNINKESGDRDTNPIYVICLDSCLIPDAHMIASDALYIYGQKVVRIRRKNYKFPKSTANIGNSKRVCTSFCNDLCDLNKYHVVPGSCRPTIKFYKIADGTNGSISQKEETNFVLVKNSCEKTCANGNLEEISQNALFIYGRNVTLKNHDSMTDSSTLSTRNVFQTIKTRTKKVCRELCLDMMVARLNPPKELVLDVNNQLILQECKVHCQNLHLENIAIAAFETYKNKV